MERPINQISGCKHWHITCIANGRGEQDNGVPKDKRYGIGVELALS